MKLRVSPTFVVLAALAVLPAWAGCKPGPAKVDKSAATSGLSPATARDSSAAQAARRTVEPPPPLKIPQVALSDELLATCVLKVGDTIPGGQLQGLDGKPCAITSLLGKKLTVLFFWTAADAHSRRQVEDMGDDVAGQLSDKGVAVIGIDHGDPLDKARKVVAEAGVKYTMLQDPDGKYFQQLAKSKIMRTYLLDAQGKILWFDVEYSQGTQRDLMQAINVALGKRG